MPRMSCDVLVQSISAVPAGAWAVGVSGGADSVALLALLRERPDVRCHVAHLDHETRDGESAADARFVVDLCARWDVACSVARRSEIEPARAWPANRSARFRAMRFHWYREACDRHGLGGVILAHHADDQAETFVQRLIRGSGPAGLAGMRADVRIGGLRVMRPLLGARARELRSYLNERGQPWREDASNASPAYQRNRVRAVLAGNEPLAEAARGAAAAMGALNAWARAAAPRPGETFAVRELADRPIVLAQEAARRWLVARGAAAGELSGAVLARLVAMASDAATPPRQQVPGGVTVWRRGGRMGAV
jgi:tRNA(Ile)-lysidine synthase